MILSIIIAALFVAFLLWVFIGREFEGSFGIAWALLAAFQIALAFGLGYVITHFVTKYW